jgi:hypothetical protein
MWPDEYVLPQASGLEHVRSAPFSVVGDPFDHRRGHG